MNANQQVYEVPLVELLERVPKDARFWVEEKHSSTHYPVGRLSHEAAEMLRQQQAEIEALKDIISELEYVMSFGENGYEDLDKHGKDGLIPHYTHPVELTEETKEALIVTRSIAMRMAAEARIPECGDFAKIARFLDFACDELAILRKAQE